MDVGAQPDQPSRAAYVVLIGCRGALVGSDNRQINIHVYRVEVPRIDFSGVLERRAVREALRRAAADPDDPKLRKEAERELRAGSWHLFRRDTIDLGKQERQSSTSDPATRDTYDRLFEGIEGGVCLVDCQGAAVGDHIRQVNRFEYIAKDATVNASALLEQSKTAARALTDALLDCDRKSERALDRAFSDALKRCSAARDLEKLHSARPVGNIIRDRDGVTAGGRNNEEEHEAKVVPRLTEVELSQFRPVLPPSPFTRDHPWEREDPSRDLDGPGLGF